VSKELHGVILRTFRRTVTVGVPAISAGNKNSLLMELGLRLGKIEGLTSIV